MNNMIKKISAILVLISCFHTVVSAFGDSYPEHPQYAELKETETLSRYGYSETNSDYIFEVDGKKFILLDTDTDGNYFVLTEDLYGKRAFDTSYDRGYYSYERLDHGVKDTSYNPSWTLDINEILFSTTDSTNIGYWLNKTFLYYGNSGNKLPTSIRNNIIDSNWAVEGIKSAVISKEAQEYDNGRGKQISEQEASKYSSEPYTVTGKLALMSATEYKKYQDIIGFVHSDETWRGMMLRTPRMEFYCTDWETEGHNYHYLSIGWGNVKVMNNGSNKMVMVYNSLPQSAENFVRPCFWLDKNFFKNVKCNIETLGKYPMREVRKNSYEDLSKIYSNNELKLLKVYDDSTEYENVLPSIKNLEVIGDASVGKVLKCDYEFIKGSNEEHEGLNEFFSEITWYYSNTPKGEKVVIENVSTETLILTENLKDKYIWVSVTPENGFQKKGEPVYSDFVMKVKPQNEINVVFKNVQGDEITNLDFVDSVRIDISSTSLNSEKVLVCITKYDADKRLVLVNNQEIHESFSTSNTVDIETGDLIKVIVLGNSEFPNSIYEIR